MNPMRVPTLIAGVFWRVFGVSTSLGGRGAAAADPDDRGIAVDSATGWACSIGKAKTQEPARLQQKLRSRKIIFTHRFFPRESAGK